MNGEIIAVTLGDPDGIGPEVVRKSIETLDLKRPLLLIGRRESWMDALVRPVAATDTISESGIYYLELDGNPKVGTDPSFAYVKEAAELALAKTVAALVTAPISKGKWCQSGLRFTGHTDYLATLSNRQRVRMCFWGADLRLVLFTTHIPLAEVAEAVRRERVADFICDVDQQLHQLFRRRFRFYISGLNPHCGEEGFLGNEEAEIIGPALEEVADRVDIAGLYPADVVFHRARRDSDSVVLAWYHDQGLIPFKLLHFDSGVNLTLGLPFVRTSPDHGTAFDIAGKELADPGSMRAAIRLADSILDIQRSAAV